MSATRTGLLSICPLLFLASFATASPPEIRQYPSGPVVSIHQLPEAMCRGWVEVRTTSATQLPFWDILLEVEGNSRLLLGCNPDYIYALALTGGFDNGVQRLTPGMASLWPHFGGNGDGPAIYDFSAGTLVKLFTTGNQAKDPGLADLARIQQSLQSGPRSKRAEHAALSPDASPFRTFPEIMAIKRASRHRGDYSLRTAKQFASALTHRDTGLLAALLSPALFDEENSISGQAVKPNPARIAFAERLVALNDAMETFSGLRELGNLRYEMRSEKQAFHLTLQEAEGCFYVKRLDPEP